MSHIYDSSDSEDENGNEAILSSTPNPQAGQASLLLTPPPNTAPSHGGDALLRPRSRSRTSSFSSPLLSSRPRSASFLDDAAPGGENTNGSNSNSRPSSAHRRPSSRGNRSGGRNRRSITPVVLGPVHRSALHHDDEGHANANDDPTISSPESGPSLVSFSARHRSPQSSSNTNYIGTSTSSGTSSTTTHHKVVGLGAGLSVGTILPVAQRQLSSLQETRREHRFGNAAHFRSQKQGPGHRKVRRWNNDKFIGIATDISHSNPMRGTKIADIYAEAEMQRDKYIMPNANRPNRTIFSTLAAASSSSSPTFTSSIRTGEDDDEEGMDDHHGYNDDDDDDMSNTRNKISLSPEAWRKIRDRFVEGEVGQASAITTAYDKNSTSRQIQMQSIIYRNGDRMMRTVDHRLRRIVERACRRPCFARNVVDAFEKLIVHSFTSTTSSNTSPTSSSIDGSSSSSSTRDAIDTDDGTGGSANIRRNPSPSFSMEDHCGIWKAALVQTPMVTTRKTNSGRAPVTIRFLFGGEDCSSSSGDGDGDGDSGGRNAFHRLLLHAVCQFHGLEASSSTTKKGHRMLTVNGCCRGSQFHFLDYVGNIDIEGDENNDDENDEQDKIEKSTDRKLQAPAVSAQTQLDETPGTQMLLETMAALKVQ